MAISNGIKFSVLGALALAALAPSACSSTNGGGSGGSTGTTATTGTTSTGTTTGTTSGGGGTTGTTTTTTGTSTTTTSSGSTTVGCAMSDAPTGATILGSTDDGGLSINGGLTNYGGAAAPTVTTDSTGTLTIAESGTAGTAPQYVGGVVYMSGNATGTDCVNASTYTGVEFTVSGTTSTNCTISFSINDSEHTAVSATDPKASGAAGSYSGSVPVTPTSTPTQQKVTFASIVGGMPATALDPTKLEAIQWQFTIPPGTGTCDSTLTITGISFY